MGLTIQDILRQSYHRWALNHPVSLDMSHAVHQMMNCRTACMGGHVNSCPDGTTIRSLTTHAAIGAVHYAHGCHASSG